MQGSGASKEDIRKLEIHRERLQEYLEGIRIEHVPQILRCLEEHDVASLDDWLALNTKERDSVWADIAAQGKDTETLKRSTYDLLQRSSDCALQKQGLNSELPALNPSCFDALYRTTRDEAYFWFAFTMVLKLLVNLIFLAGQIFTDFEWGLWLQILLIMSALTSYSYKPCKMVMLSRFVAPSASLTLVDHRQGRT